MVRIVERRVERTKKRRVRRVGLFEQTGGPVKTARPARDVSFHDLQVREVSASAVLLVAEQHQQGFVPPCVTVSHVEELWLRQEGGPNLDGANVVVIPDCPARVSTR